MQHNDMHVHTSSSPDAEISAPRLCLLGAGAGVERIGFVAHLDLHPGDFCHGGFREEDYLTELDLAEKAGGASVLRGLEIGEPHRFMDGAVKMFSPDGYDFITGALHWLGDRMILEDKPFLCEKSLPLIEEYYRQTLSIVKGGGVDILAHMGIFRRGMARAGLPVDIDETLLFPGLLSDILSTMIERGIALELNTSGLRRPERTTYPTLPVLKLYHELGGHRVTIGSDTHREEHVFFGLEKGRELLADCGFREYGYFRSRGYISCPLH